MNLDHLTQVAQAASQEAEGDWFSPDLLDSDAPISSTRKARAYIAAISPDVALALIAALRQSLAQPERQRIERLRGALKSASGWLLDAGDLDNAQACLRMAGDAEAPALAALDVDALSVSDAKVEIALAAYVNAGINSAHFVPMKTAMREALRAAIGGPAQSRPLCKECNGRGWEAPGTRCNAPGCDGGYIGHRDARHAAAELLKVKP